MITDIQIDTRELEILAAKFESLGGKFKENENIKSAFKSAAKYLIGKGKSNLRKRVVDQANWQILNWFSWKVGRKGTYSLAGFSKPKITMSQMGKKHVGVPWWLNEGTKPRWTKAGHYTGSATPNYFWDDVKKDNLQDAAQYVIDALRLEIQKLDI